MSMAASGRSTPWSGWSPSHHPQPVCRCRRAPMASRADGVLRAGGLAIARALQDDTGMSSDRAPETPAAPEMPAAAPPGADTLFSGARMQRFASVGALLVTIGGLLLFAYTLQHAGVRQTA